MCRHLPSPQWTLIHLFRKPRTACLPGLFTQTTSPLAPLHSPLITLFLHFLLPLLRNPSLVSDSHWGWGEYGTSLASSNAGV